MITTGFIGLGAMGAPMAGHLHQHGLLAAVWNRSGETIRDISALIHLKRRNA